jgi:hypothetical protein
MLLNHRCGHPLWMEWTHVGGSPDQPRYWDQDPRDPDGVTRCPACGSPLPLSPREHFAALENRRLIPTPEPPQIDEDYEAAVADLQPRFTEKETS